MNKMKLEHGFTLLELLASIVIIVIVLTSFFSFFSQSAMFSKKNEENLVAMNLAREVLEEVKENSSNYNDDECYEAEANNGLYHCLVFKEELTTDGTTIPNLRRVIVEIRQLEDNALLTKTYGYVRDDE